MRRRTGKAENRKGCVVDVDVEDGKRERLHPAALGILGAGVWVVMPFVPEAALLLRVGGHERLAPAVFRLLSAFADHVVEKMRLMRKIFLFGVG